MMATAVDQLTEPEQPAPALYGVVREALGAINDGSADALIELWFKLRLLDTQGYRPELGHCVICGQNSPEAAYAFSPDRGGIVCRSDSGPLDAPMTAPQIKFWRLLSDYPYATISQIAGAQALAIHTLPLCDTFYEHHLGKAFRPR
jgi:DNA repair protein RecO (recombination protein O)